MLVVSASNLATDTFGANYPYSWLARGSQKRRLMFPPRLSRTMWQSIGSFTDRQQKWQGKAGSTDVMISDESWLLLMWPHMRPSRRQWCDLLESGAVCANRVAHFGVSGTSRHVAPNPPCT